MRFFHIQPALLVLALLSACDSDEGTPQPSFLSVEELQDPQTCESCHPTHYREWKASMHAYATDDPVFVAMNALGQEETNGEMGTFCVNCHAPMAVKAGITDGSPESVAAIPDHMKGVTCYFCHNAVEVSGDNNAMVTLANDQIMRGAIRDPIQPSAHGVEGSDLLNSRSPESNKLCGGCHDIVNDKGVHLERTFAEYKETIFGQDGSEGFVTCAACHMPTRPGFPAMDETGGQVAERSVHSHLWPGVDVAVTPWPDREEYAAAVACALDQGITLIDTSQSEQGLHYDFETMAGHMMPSGASQDRRMWVETIMFTDDQDGDGEDDIFCSLGNVPDDEAVATFTDPIACNMTRGAPASDDTVSFPLYRDRIFDEDGVETHMFWRAAPSDRSESGHIGRTVQAATGYDDNGDPIKHTEQLIYQIPVGVNIKRVTIRVKMRPMDFDVLEELIEAELLDDAIRDEIPTFTLAAGSVDYELDPVSGIYTATRVADRTTNCYEAFFCAFDSEAPACQD